MNRIFNTEWLIDNRSVAVVFLLVILVLLSATLVIGAYSVTHAPTPYELRVDHDKDINELRNRVTANQDDQRLVNTSTTNEFVGNENSIDEIEQEIERIERAEHIPVHHFHHRK